MERIVLGYDGSPAAEAALDWITDRLVRRSGLVEVIVIANMFLSSEADTDELRDRAEQRLRMRVPALPVETSMIDGLMPGALVHAARDADLLVIGVEHGHPIRSAWHGWLPQRVSTSSAVPTCVVPHGWSPAGGAVAVGLDDDDSSAAAVEFAAAEALADSHRLRLVHSWATAVEPADRGAPPTPRYRMQVQHQQYAAAVAERVRQAHPSLDVRVELAQSNPSAMLTTAARDSALVVIGTHGHGILAGGLAGSVALDLIGKVTAQVCVVPPRP